jgi:transcriptional regulator with XRE-family HTH domain
MFTWQTVATRADRFDGVSDDLPLDRSVAVRLGTQIRDLREARQLSQEKLADAVGLTRNHLQLLESGLSDRAKNTPANPRLSTLMALSRELGAELRIDMAAPTAVTIEFVAAPE